MKQLLVLLVSVLALTGCPSAEETPTWHGDIAPIVETYCARCHFDGGPGPVNFSDREQAEAWAEVALARIDAGEMPPPAADPACRDYHGAERMVLPAEARDAFAAWIDGGKPVGETRPLDIEPLATELEQPDVVVRLPEPYLPSFDDPDSPANEYRCFLLEHEQDETFWIAEMAPVLDAAHLVHHIVVFRTPDSSVPEDYDPAVGYECQDSAGESLPGMIAGWAPGMTPIVFEQGTGIRVEPGTRIGVQMHYFRADPTQPPVTDQSGYAFKVTEQVKTEMRMFPVGTTNFSIPPGEDDYTREGSMNMPSFLGAVTIHGVMPHLHVLGSGFSMWRTLNGERECIVEMVDYDFDNQLTYMLKPPVHLDEREEVGFSCSWDNSAENPDQFFDPPREIRYGERTDEEMCFGFSLVSFTP